MKIRARNTLPACTAVALRARSVAARLSDRVGDERGDVPGWVMVTVMTAMLVAFIGTVAQDELQNLLTTALKGVTSSW